MRELKEIQHLRSYNEKIFGVIDEFFKDTIFYYLMAVANQTEVYNSSEKVINGLISNNIFYLNGQFYSKTGRFSNEISNTFEQWGAVYNLRERSFVIKSSNIPLDVLGAISQVNISNDTKLDTMLRYIDGIGDNLDFVTSKIDFGGEVTDIIGSLDGQYRDSVKTINIIPDNTTPYMQKLISTEYTNNMKLYIQKWTEKEISKLRQEIQQIVNKGYRADKVKEYILSEYGHSVQKSTFLAKQETSLMVSKYRETRFKEAGVTHYRWATILDGRERIEHEELNGEIISWDFPPISNRATGRKCHAGVDFGCRCRTVPIIPD